MWGTGVIILKDLLTLLLKKAHKIRLNPTPEQIDYFWKATKVSRNAWNWALSEYNRRSGEGKKVKITGKGDTLKAEYTSIKNDFEFAYDVTSYASQQAFLDLQRAISTYFDKKKKGLLKPSKDRKPRKDGKPFGWPRFKSIHRTIPSFYEANLGLRFNGYHVKFPKLGVVNMAEQLRFDGKVLGARVSYRQNHWWLSVQVEFEADIIIPKNGAVGIDLGIKYLATTSNGAYYENPKAFIVAQNKLRRLQRKLDRQRRANNPDNYNENGTAKKGVTQWVVSGKMKKTEAAITKLHAKIANIRIDASHKLTTELTNEYSIICLEDLNIKGMLQNGRLSKAISDAAFYEKRRQFEYKAKEHEVQIVFIDQWFPSSKLCNACEEWIYAELDLSEREWICQNCGSVNERDENAALNIRDEGLRILQGESSPEYQHGDAKRPDGNVGQRPSVVREK